MNLPSGVRLFTRSSFGSMLAAILFIFTSQLAFAQTVDLAIQGASISPTSVASGNTVTANGSIYNLGSTSAATSNIGFYLSSDNLLDNSDNLIGYANGSNLNAGASSFRNVTLIIPGGTAPGSYYILYVADYLNAVSESNENNNISSVSIAVVPPSVDFTISSAYLYSNSVAAGGSTSTESNIYNQGNSTASSSNVGYYLSTNTSFDNGDVFIGFSSGGSLSAGNSRYATATLTIPANTLPGTYYIIFVADYLDGITESNESNNTTSRQINVVAPFVDLLVQSPYINGSSYNASGTAGSTTSTESRIHNQGNSTASSSNVGYYLSTNNTFDNDDVFIGSSSGGALTASNYNSRYGSITIPSNTAPGAYYILFVADYLNGVTESNESNNVSSIAFSVLAPSVDLTLNSLNIGSGSISAGNPISIDVTASNQGNTNAASSNLGYYLSTNTTLDAADVLIGFLNGSGISANNSAFRSTSPTIPANTAPGNYYLIVAADYLNSVSETNENNNTAYTAITIMAQGTMFITPRSGSTSFTTCTGKVYDHGGTGSYGDNAYGSITLNPATAGNKIRLTFNFLAVESCCDRLYIYDGTSTSAPLIGIYYTNPGTVYATNSSGALTLLFTSDGSITGSGFEADIACVTSIPLPDLTILSPTANPASLPAGTTVSVNASVSNNSTVNASSSNLGFYLSANNTFEPTDILLGSSTGTTLTAGGSAYHIASLTIPANTTPGAYYLLYVADPQSAVSEDNEANNVASVAINVQVPTTDLLLLSAFTSSSTIASGNSFTVTSFIANQGSTPAPSSYVSYFLSTNRTYEPTDLSFGNSFGSILAGGNSSQRSRTLTLPATVTAGNYYIVFVADSANLVVETNETNNTRSVPITVTSPNYVELTVTTKSIANPTLLIGEPVAASGTIINYGNVTAPRSAVGFYLSADNTLDASDILLGSAISSGPLAPGATEEVPATLTIPVNTATGSYYILFKADYDNQVAESQEADGYTYLSVAVIRPAIDLLVQTPTVTPATALPGAEITITAAIRNQGTVAASTSTIGYYLSADNALDAADELLGFYAGDALAANTSSAPQTARLNLPATTPPGAYYILLAADHNNHEAETDEANNVQAVAITAEPALANLTFNATTVSTNTIIPGSLISVTDSLQNYGTVPAQTSNVAYYLSENATLDAADGLLGTSFGNQLANRPHSGAYKSATLTIPANTAAGRYYLLFVADPDNLVAESNETDNLVSHTITITAADVDLIVQNQTLSPAVAAAGNAVAVAASISNQGTTPANASAMAYYLSANPSWESSDVLLGVSDGSTLAAGSSAYRHATVTIPAETASGTYYLLFVGDHTNSTAETNENNNVAAQAITVSAPTSVDLVVQSPSGFPASVTAGNQVSISSFIYNQGVAPAASSSVGYYLSTNNTYDAADVLLGFSAGEALTAAGSASRTGTLTIPAATSAGTYYLLFVADHARAVAESDETNNTSTLAISVAAPAFADFTLQSPAANPSSVLAGTSVAVSATIRNQGTAVAASSNLSYYLSADNVLDEADLLLDMAAGHSLAAGASAARSATLTIPAGTPAGSYYILFAADPDNAVAESNETNNLAPAALTVIAPAIDLLVQGPTLLPAAALPGNTLDVSAEILNQGTIAATASSVGYYLSDNHTLESGDVLLGFSAGGALAAGSTASKSATLPIPANTAAGNYYLLFVADHTGAETERDEANNSAAVAFTVIAPTLDLAVQAPAASVTALVAGNDLSVAATILNSGSGAAATSPVHYFLSADHALDDTDIALGNAAGGALAAGASAFRTATVTIPANTATGNYYILFVADQAQAVDEADEANNVMRVALAVTASNIDLVVQNPSVASASVVSGNSVSVATTIANTGNAAAPASPVGYYLSANTTLESTDVVLGNAAGGSLAAGASAARTATVTIPANTAAGNYYVLFAADPAAAVTETNETNNVAQVALTVASPTGPDLIAGNPSVTGPLIRGRAYSITSDISNQGTAASASSSIGFYLSLDNVLDGTDVFLNAATGTGLAVAAASARTATLTIPANTPAGSNYRILAVADYLNGVAETNETNNTGASGNFSVVDPTVDVLIEYTMIVPGSAAPHNSITVSADVVNRGNSTASSFGVGYYLSTNTTLESSDILLNSMTIVSLTNGGTTPRDAGLEIPGGTAPGSYYLLVVADYNNALTESNESNNVRATAFTVLPTTIDLVVQSTTATVTNLVTGGSTSVTANLANTGNTAAPSSNVAFYLSANNTFETTDVLLSTVTGGYLSRLAMASRTASITIPTGTAAGSYYLLAVVDKDNTVTESNETNNVGSVAITVAAPTVDLVIQSLTAGTVLPESILSVSLNLLNSGNSTASSSDISFYLSANATLEGTDSRLDLASGGNLSAGSALPAGSSATRAASVSIPSLVPGNYFLLALVDPNNAIAENNETNNVQSFGFTVEEPFTELEMQSFTVSDNTLAPGELAYINARVSNIGNQKNVVGDVSFYLSANNTYEPVDVLLTNIADQYLEGHFLLVNEPLTIPPTTAPGSYYILAMVDQDNSILERNEGNNMRSVAITVVAPGADLVVQLPLIERTTIAPNTSVIASATIGNTGTTAATSSNLSLYLSTNPTFDAADILLLNNPDRAITSPGGSLAAGASSDRTSLAFGLPANTAPGSYYILYVADPTNTVTEGNETNNVSALAITVVASGIDLVVQSIASPEYISAGQFNSFSAHVLNQGMVTAIAPFSIGIYLSSDLTLDPADNLIGSDRYDLSISPGATGQVLSSLNIPANTPSGFYYVLVKADYNNTLAESDETNNVRGIELLVVDNAASDLVFTPPVSVTPNPVAAGSALRVDAHVANAGGPAAHVVIDYYLSADNILDEAADVLLGTYTSADALNGTRWTTPPGRLSTSQPLTIPEATAAGNYYIIARLDPTQAVAEGNEANNLTSVAISVAARPLPDLTFTTPPSLSQTTVAAGERTFAVVSVRNLGPGRASATTVGYYLSADPELDASDALIGNSFIWDASMWWSFSTSSSLQIPPGTTSGAYYVLVVADYHDNLPEANEANNVISVPITVGRPAQAPQLPDLALAGSFSFFDLGTAGDTLRGNFTVQNMGAITAGASHVGWYLSQAPILDNSATFLAQTLVDTLASGHKSARFNQQLILPDNLAPGQYYLFGKVDYQESVTEASENNNVWSTWINITGGGSDLEISGFELMTTGGPANTVTNTRFGIVNSGATPVESGKVNFYFSDNITFEPTDLFLGSSDITPLAGNQRATFTASLTIPAEAAPGVYYIVAVVDPDKKIAETQESNNTAVDIFTIGALDVSIVPGSAAWLRNLSTNTVLPAGPVTVEAGHRLEASFIARKAGNVPPPGTQATWLLSTDPVYDTTDVLLSSNSGLLLTPKIGDTYQYPLITIPPDTRTGAYYLLFVLDKDNAITETDETNNLQALPINVIGAPLAELAIQSPVVNVAAAPAGATLALAATLANTGPAAAPASNLRYYLSGDAMLDSTDVALASQAAAPLEPSASRTITADVTLPANTALGSYHILMVADADSTVREENELNNVSGIPFQVGRAGKDLIVQVQSGTPDSIVAGSAIPVMARLFNQGVEAAASAKTGIYLSANATLDDADLLIGTGTGGSLAALTGVERHFGFTIPLSTVPGNYYVIFKADPEQEVPESDEDNNTLAVSLAVTAAAPDLSVQAPALSAATVARGGALTLTATLANLGGPSLAGKAQYYLSTNNTLESGDVLLGESEVPALAAGASSPVSAALTIPVTTATGDYFVLLVADATGLAAESDEANNVTAVPVAVSVASGIQDLEASYTVAIGPNPAPEQVYISIDKLDRSARFADVALHDMSGRQVFTTRAAISNTSLRTQVEVAHLSQGTYLLHIRIGNKVTARRIVVERR